VRLVGILNVWQRLRASTSGNLTMMVALSALPVFAAIGVAIDYSRHNDAEARIAAALDGAVLAGAATDTDNVKAAQDYFDANIAADGLKNIQRSFTLTSATSITVTGTAGASLDTVFGSIGGYPDYHVAVEAAAARSASTTTTTTTNNGVKLCILALSPTASQSLLANSGADVNAASCEIHVRSTANPAAIFNAGTNIKSKNTCIAGTNIIDNGGTHPNLNLGCSAISDPYAGKVPVPASATCDYNNMNYSGAVTLNPGVYCGWMNFNAGPTVTLKPGLYVIKNGGWNVNGGDWSGNGVTFYFEDTSKIQFNSAVKASLKAPTSGTYADFLFAEKSGLSNTQFIFDDNQGFDMTGIMYLPSRDVVFNSSTSVRAEKMTAVMNTVIFNGIKWNLVHYDNGGGSTTTTTTVAASDVRLIK
jgi:Flp pilus assembly protein TadG